MYSILTISRRQARRASLYSLSAAIIVALCLAVNAGQPDISYSAAGNIQSRYFASTGHTVTGAFLTFFDRYGGVRVFGYPLSDAVTEDGRLVQYFERQRFEHHKEAAGTRHEVQLSRLGAELAPPQALTPYSAPFANNSRQVYFPQTRHSLSHSFLDFWKAGGGLPILGYPITEPYMENGFLVQYFERARMEYHPEKADSGYGVELGLLGKRYLEANPQVMARLASGSRSVSPTSRGSEPERAPAQPANPLTAGESELITRINEARKAAGAGPVSVENTLRGISLSRSKDMVERAYFSHTTPDGTDFLAMIKAAGISFKYAGEILANNNYSDGESALQAYNSFINSPNHRQILLDARYNLAGVGEAANSQGFHYFTVIFIQK